FEFMGKPLISNRKGVYQYQPAYFTGDGSPYDGRVAIVWYTQPFRGLRNPPAAANRTIVEGAVGYRIDKVHSTFTFEAGNDYGPVASYTLPNDEGPVPADPRYGQYFVPCPRIDGTVGYFGDYIGGAFKYATAGDPSTLAAWT